MVLSATVSRNSDYSGHSSGIKELIYEVVRHLRTEDKKLQTARPRNQLHF